MEVRKQEKSSEQVVPQEQKNHQGRKEGQIRPEIMRIVRGVMRDFKKDLDYLKDK